MVLDEQKEEMQTNEEVVEKENKEVTVESLEKMINSKDSEIMKLKDDYLRIQAEMQNSQRRSLEELKRVKEYSISGFAKDIIIVKDYLEMALKDDSDNIQAIKMGVELTLKQLSQVFEHHLLKEINPKIGDKLDANLHQAVDTVESQEEHNSIVTVMQKGYSLHDRILRPAMVVIAK